MPPELCSVYRSRGEKIFCLLSILFCLAFVTILHLSAITYNHVFHDALIVKKTLMIFFIDGMSFLLLLFSIWGTIYSNRYRLVFDENGITQIGTLSTKTIRISEITTLKWDIYDHPKIKLKTNTIRITIGLDMMRSDKERQKILIPFLRNSVPFERQSGWKHFCYQMEHSKYWSDKNIILLPDPSQGEILYTRKMYNWSIPWMIIGSFIPLIVMSYLTNLMQLQNLLRNDLLRRFAPAVIYIGMIWGYWLAIRYGIPKNGKVIKKKHLLIERLFFTAMGLMLFVYPLLAILLIRSIFWGHTVIYMVVISLFILMFWLAYQIRKHKKHAIESLPDDYMPIAFKK